MTDNIDRKLRAILFADIAGYTAQMQQDESVARRQIQVFRREIESHITLRQGEVVNFYGDGCVCIFSSSVNAVTCAQNLQESFIASSVPVRIGIHSGDVYFEDDNVYGDSVNIASRMETLAIPGSVLFSARVRHDIKNQTDLPVAFLGDFDLKNVEDTMEVYALAGGGLVIPQELKTTSTTPALTGKKSKSNWTNRIVIGSFLLVAVFLVGRELLRSYAMDIDGDPDQKKVLAILDFNNSTGDTQFDVVSQMTVNRIVHGITQNAIASVVTKASVDMYKSVVLSASKPMDELDWLSSEMSVDHVINGSIYLDEGELIFESIITDTRTKEIIQGLPIVRCSSNEPMKCIEELRQVVLGAFATSKDKELNLSLETRPPKFEAYKQLLLSKEAEDDEREFHHLTQAIALDSNFFEPKVLLIGNFYNRGAYLQADSMLSSISDGLKNADSRQNNLLNFYSALLKGKSNLVCQFIQREWDYAPFDLPTNRTLLVVALEFIYDLENARKWYNAIPDENMDFASCAECRLRLYLKMYLELEEGNQKQAIRAGDILLKNNGEDWAADLLIRAYAELDSTRAIDNLISTLVATTNMVTPFNLLVVAGREFAILGDDSKAKMYAEKALDQVTPETDTWRQAEAHYISGDHTTAMELFVIAVNKDSNDLRAWGFLAGIAMLNDDTQLANSSISELESKRGPFQFGDVDYYLARAYAMSGNFPKSFASLRASIAQGQRNGTYQFQNDYIFRPSVHKEALLEIMKYWL